MFDTTINQNNEQCIAKLIAKSMEWLRNSQGEAAI
jgi:hypothetical protein